MTVQGVWCDGLEAEPNQLQGIQSQREPRKRKPQKSGGNHDSLH